MATMTEQINAETASKCEAIALRLANLRDLVTECIDGSVTGEMRRTIEKIEADLAVIRARVTP